MIFLMMLALAACGGGPAVTTGKAEGAGKAATADQLLGTEWLLEDLGGSGVLEGIQATLAFPQAGRIAGQGSCNRYTGPVTLGADGAFKAGQFAMTRMACPPAVMDQETQYIQALANGERVAFDGPSLILFTKGMEKPLRFIRKK
jgi:heat shock protein HslJ